MPDAAIHHVSSGSRRKIGTATSTFDNDEYEIISLVTVRLLTCAKFPLVATKDLLKPACVHQPDNNKFC